MKIKVLKTNFASKDQTGTKIFEYEAGEVYDIYQELAEVFISQGWGVAEEIEIETQDFPILKEEIETQDFPILKEEIETQEEEIEIETQDFPILKEEIETQDIEIQIETQDFPKKKKPTKEKEKDAN